MAIRRPLSTMARLAAKRGGDRVQAARHCDRSGAGPGCLPYEVTARGVVDQPDDTALVGCIVGRPLAEPLLPGNLAPTSATANSHRCASTKTTLTDSIVPNYERHDGNAHTTKCCGATTSRPLLAASWAVNHKGMGIESNEAPSSTAHQSLTSSTRCPAPGWRHAVESVLQGVASPVMRVQSRPSL